MIAPRHPLAVALLSLPAALYGGLVRLRNRHYDRPGVPRRCGIPVISVGNITVGGTGKTPIVGYLAELLRDRGRRPAVVSRGYGGAGGRGPTLVSDGNGPLCDADVCGDEPHLLARTLADVLVVVGADRVAAAADARRRGADVIVLDDGYQHRRLARDLDIVLLDSGSPFGNDRLLPAGPLREPVAAIGRAQLVLITRSRADDEFPTIERIVRGYNPDAPILRAGHRVVGFVDGGGKERPRPERAVAFCGIGNPGRFRADLLGEGLELLDFQVFRDHHRYTVAEMRELARIAQRDGAVPVTTEKDLARLPASLLLESGLDPCALRIRPEIHDLPPFLEAVDAVTRGDDR